jgi:hypothetical protein
MDVNAWVKNLPYTARATDSGQMRRQRNGAAPNPDLKIRPRGS